MIAETIARGAVGVAALIVVPLAYPLLSRGAMLPSLRLARALHWPAVVCLGISFCCQQGSGSAAWAAPWALLTTILGIGASVRLFALLGSRETRSLSEICRCTASVFLSIGGAWLISDRLGIRPLDFDPVIVTLTAAHFHYAGFALTLLTACAVEGVRGWRPGVAAIGVILGVPLVATGITTTHLGGPTAIETGSTLILAVSVLALCWLLADRVTELRSTRAQQLLWVFTALCLVTSIGFAVLYGLRHVLGEGALGIDTMAMTHGILNVLGPGIAGIAGARLARKNA